jgi:1-acyl-sn-glycerol-3-phosphate acyltransferase
MNQSKSVDPFRVAPQRSLLIAIPLFLVMLPLTMLGLMLTVVSGFAVIPTYRRQSLATRDRRSKFVIAVLMATARFQIRVVDHNPSEAHHAKLYVAPHICMLEAMMLIWAKGHIRPMTAEFTRRLPVFGPFVHAADPIYVKRGKTEGGPSVVDLLRESLETTPYRHLIFPEGTFTNGDSLIQFKSGAFAPGHPVTPIVFTYPEYRPFWNREESGFGMQLFRMLSRVRTPVTMEFLPTYHPSDAERADARLYAENVRKTIAAHCGRPMSDLSLRDSPNFRKDS